MGARGSSDRATSRRWWALGVVGLAQLMVVLDSTVVTIALPSAQADLGMPDAIRAWVVTAYALAFGGLLLVGGRLVDRLGQRRALVVGLVGFGLASVLAGAAPVPGLLFAGRAAQGVFAAVLAPAALAVIATTFTDPRERGTAFGVFGALTGAGAAVGLLAGGLLTEYAGWRWCLFVNVPIVGVALAGVAAAVPAGGPRLRVPLDVAGAVVSAAGLLAVVFAFSEVATRGWSDPLVVGLLAAGVALLVVFALVESRVSVPLLPLHVLADRVRGGAFLAIGLPQLAMFGFFLFLTYWFQQVLGYPPLRAGLAFLPLAVAIGVGSTVVAGRLMSRLAARTMIVPALLVMAAGMALLIGLDPDADAAYLVRVLPAELLLGAGLGCVLTPAMSAATAGVAPADAGIASAAVNAVSQLGGSLGTALLNTVATTVTAAALARPAAGAAPASVVEGATVEGFDSAIQLATAILVGTAVVVALVLPGGARRRAGA